MFLDGEGFGAEDVFRRMVVVAMLWGSGAHEDADKIVPANTDASRVLLSRGPKCDVIFMTILNLVFYLDDYKKLIATRSMAELR